jgi:type IV secretory pathway TraG/TraD family ATPase VirD4
VLGESSNASDLADISRLLGEREVVETSQSYQTGSSTGAKSVSTSIRRINVLDPSTIRTLKFGHGLLLFKASQPIIIALRPWINRNDANSLRDDRAHTEALVRQVASEALGDG